MSETAATIVSEILSTLNLKIAMWGLQWGPGGGAGAGQKSTNCHNKQITVYVLFPSEISCVSGIEKCIFVVFFKRMRLIISSSLPTLSFTADFSVSGSEICSLGSSFILRWWLSEQVKPTPSSWWNRLPDPAIKNDNREIHGNVKILSITLMLSSWMLQNFFTVSLA